MTQLDRAYYEEIAKNLTFQTKAFIGGKFVPALSGKTLSTINPATGKVITEFSNCGKEDIDLAVSIARKVFESGVWSKCHPAERKQVLLKFADLIEANITELAVLESVDSGKPVGECLAVDLQETLHCLRWHAEFIDKRYGSLSPSGDDAVGLIVKEASGVVACIMPWNFPIMTTTWKFAPALAEGNSVILKPATFTALSTLRLAELGAEAGIPEGVLQVIPGEGRVIGQALGLHNGIDVISFTGSTDVGRKLLEYSAQSNLKKIVLELGGKSPFVLLDDVKDLSNAVENALAASFWNTGQNCTSNSRIIVPVNRKEEFAELMLQGLEKSWRMGEPLDPVNNLGPMVSEQQFNSVMGFINKGIEEGNKTIIGGKPMELRSKLYIPPTIFVDPTPNSTLVVDEIFGPVTCIMGAKSNEEALAMANDTIYGLQATLYTDNLRLAHKYAKALKAGTVSVNKYCEGDITTPFGGFKLSGFGGQDKAIQAHDQYSEIKTIFINLAD